MFLTVPRHEVLAHEGVRMPYVGKFFYDLCAYRDQEENNSIPLLHRVTCEIGYIGLTLLSLIEAIVRLPFATIAAAFSSERKNWLFGVNACILTTLYSLCAVVCNLFVKNLSESVIHFDIALRSPFADDLLFDACVEGRYDLAKKLIEEYKADPHHVDASTQVSPALIPHLTGYTELQKLFKLNDYEEKYLVLKRLGHWLSLDGEVEHNEQILRLEGAPSHWFFESLAESFQRFRTWEVFPELALTQSKAEILQNALYDAYVEHSYDVPAQKIKNRRLTFVGSGWKNHAICLAFYGNYMAIGNRGGADETSTLEVFKVDPSQVTPELIEKICMHQHLDEEIGKRFFYKILPALLSPKGVVEKDSICKSFKQITPSYQKSGVCALTSKKAAMRFAWAMLLENPPCEATLQQAKLESKLYTDWAAVHYLDESQIQEKFPDRQEFIDAAFRKGKKKLDRLKINRWKLTLPRFLTRRSA